MIKLRSHDQFKEPACAVRQHQEVASLYRSMAGLFESSADELGKRGWPTSRNPLWAFAPGKTSGRKSTCTHQDSLWMHLWQSRTQRAAALHLQNLSGTDIRARH